MTTFLVPSTLAWQTLYSRRSRSYRASHSGMIRIWPALALCGMAICAPREARSDLDHPAQRQDCNF